MSYVISCDVPYKVQDLGFTRTFTCPGNQEAIFVQSPTEFTASAAVESIGAGMFVALPLMLTIYGAKKVLKTMEYL